MKAWIAAAALALAACAGGPGDPLNAQPRPAGMPKVTTVVDKAGRFEPGETGWTRTNEGYRSQVSGLSCPERLTLFADDDRAVAQLLSVTAYRADGSDASCNYQAPRLGTVVTVYATYASGTGARAYFADAEAAIESRFGDGGTVFLSAPEVAGAEVRAAAFAVPEGGGNPYDRVTALWVASGNGWHVKVRATYPAAEAGAEAAGARLLEEASEAVISEAEFGRQAA